jgi:hypothetical protein
VNESITVYDQTASQFAAQRGNLRLERALNAFGTRLTGAIAGRRRVLDLGCGPGRDVDHLA